jgi:hypothetical protein
MDGDLYDVSHLRRELLYRLDAHAINEWGPELLSAVVAIMDVQLMNIPHPNGKPSLELVRTLARVRNRRAEPTDEPAGASNGR